MLAIRTHVELGIINGDVYAVDPRHAITFSLKQPLSVGLADPDGFTTVQNVLCLLYTSDAADE